MNFKPLIFLLLYLLSYPCFSYTIEYDTEEVISISPYISIYEDKGGDLTINDVTNKDFYQHPQKVPNLGISKSVFWVRIEIKNSSSIENLLLNLSLPSLDYVELFYLDTNDKYKSILITETLPINSRKYKDPDYIFDIPISYHQTKTFFLKIISNEGVQLPIKIGPKNEILNQIKIKDILSGIYFGIMMVMILYNLFVYLSVKDKSYIYYVLYIILILLTQTSLQGYPSQYLWPNLPIITQYSLFIFPCLVGVAGMIFMLVFLKVSSYSNILYKLSYLFSAIYLIPLTLVFLGHFEQSQKIMQMNAMGVSLYMLFTSAYVVRKGYQPAKYFLIAWIVFLSGVIIFILKDFEVLPFNNFTRYTMQIGSAIETVLLSFALADRINILRKEKEISQKEAFEALQKNEQLVREQNTVLEQRVEERTTELNNTLNNLKETQSQLVDAEKMASLGQLTAGVAHEINNPINFVSSNISPLKQDIEDLTSIINQYEEIKDTTDLNEKLTKIERFKEEIDYKYLKTELTTIINGIENGAKRTTEIVNSLRNFSRLDENDLMMADINEGITSTLTILKSSTSNIDIIQKLGLIPEIECYPGKLNQVFMNIINNSIQAIEENVSNIEKGKIEIETIEETDNIKIIISDNGIGIKDEVKEKIFDPFFTTKEVGKGTGLGLSIVYRIIENHHGKIEVSSKTNHGTSISISLPKNNL